MAINRTSAIMLGLKTHSFRNKQVRLFFLIARYFIWFSKMKDNDPDKHFFFFDFPNLLLVMGGIKLSGVICLSRS